MAVGDRFIYVLYKFAPIFEVLGDFILLRWSGSRYSALGSGYQVCLLLNKFVGLETMLTTCGGNGVSQLTGALFRPGCGCSK
jgi:hypothetical protein